MAEAGGAAERAEWVEAYARTRDAAEVCRRFGISRATLRKWVGRHAEGGEAGLLERSRAPRESPNRKVFAAQSMRIGAMREAGLSFVRIRAALLAEDGLDVSVATIRKAAGRKAAGGAMVEGGVAGSGVRGGAPGGAGPKVGLFATMLPEDALFRGLTAEIAGGRLPPGTRLSEERLARTHGAARGRVRDALRALAGIGLVVMEPNRAAVVATPSAEGIAEAYEARRLVEAGIVRSLAAMRAPEHVAALRQHLRRQADAERRGDKVGLVRLLTEFHLVLAALAGNAFLRGFVETLATTTSLAVLLYDQSDDPSCAVEEHRTLVRLIEAGDGDGAAGLMARHLGHNHGRQRR